MKYPFSKVIVPLNIPQLKIIIMIMILKRFIHANKIEYVANCEFFAQRK